ncbi:MAG: HNH endonuclease [Thermogutta sp.]
MDQVYEMVNAPSAEQYVQALTDLEREGHVSDLHQLLFQLHYQAPDRTVTATQLAEWAKLPSHGIVNLRYGRLGRKLCRQLGIEPELRPKDKYLYWSVWSRGWKDTQGHFLWQMLPQAAAALEQLGWVATATDFKLPDEVSETDQFIEGAVSRILVDAYERNPEARRRCIAAHGTDCVVCGFNFGTQYGPEAEGYIHVHHIHPLSSIRGSHTVDPVRDLRPVCPNCHAFLHLGKKDRKIEDVRRLLRERRKNGG